MKPEVWKLCLIADAAYLQKDNPLDPVQRAVRGGVTLVQLRAKELPIRDFTEIALQLSAYLRTCNIPLIINDRIDVALASTAQGVHLGQQDMPLLFARRILGPKKLIGISVNTADEAKQAQKQGADYLGVGPVFPTTTKKNLRPILGLQGLQDIIKQVSLPLLAIGGINSSNIGKVMATGVNGVAVASAILKSEDVERETRYLLNKIHS